MLNEVKTVKALFVAGFTLLSAKLGNLALPIYILLFFNIADYLTGIWAAKQRGEEVNSDKGFRGIAKKVCMYLVVCVGVVIDIFLQTGAELIDFQIPLHWMVSFIIAWWMVFNEMVSILENIADVGTGLPPFLLPLAKKAKEWLNEKGEEKNDG